MWGLAKCKTREFGFFEGEMGEMSQIRKKKLQS